MNQFKFKNQQTLWHFLGNAVPEMSNIYCAIINKIWLLQVDHCLKHKCTYTFIDALNF